MDYSNITFASAVFDLDGTLANTMNDLKSSMNAMLTQCGYPERSEAELLQFINGGAMNFVRRSLPNEIQENEERVAECFKLYDSIYSQHFSDQTALYSGIADCVMKLKKFGLKLGVLSNKQHLQTCGIIAKLFPPDTFDCVMGQSAYPHKPEKTATLHLLEKLGVSPSDSIMIGDSDVDIHTALNAGMFALGVTWGYRDENVLREHGAMHICHNPSQITEFILGERAF